MAGKAVQPQYLLDVRGSMAVDSIEDHSRSEASA
jgi:hypothetical protein